MAHGMHADHSRQKQCCRSSPESLPIFLNDSSKFEVVRLLLLGFAALLCLRCFALLLRSFLSNQV